MNMQELKLMIYKGEKVDTLFLGWMKIKRKICRKRDLLYRE